MWPWPRRRTVPTSDKYDGCSSHQPVRNPGGTTMFKTTKISLTFATLVSTIGLAAPPAVALTARTSTGGVVVAPAPTTAVQENGSACQQAWGDFMGWWNQYTSDAANGNTGAVNSDVDHMNRE